EHLGGICLNWGCIPTKALLRSAEVLHQARHAAAYGLKLEGEIAPDLRAVVERSRGVSARLNGGVGFLMKKNKVDVIWGEARLGGKGKVVVSAPKKKPMQPQPPAPKGAKGEGTYLARHIVVATGARPRALPGIEPVGKLIWSYFEAMMPPSLPNRLVVFGSGAIGVEFASFYNAMGSEVTVVEVLPTILPVEDAEVSAFARRQLVKAGLRIHTEAKVVRIEKKPDSVLAHVELKGGKVEKTEFDRVISAVGVEGNVEGLGLEELGVAIERGIVRVDGFGRTNVEGVHAIGDVAGAPMLAHKAEHEGIACIEKIAGLEHARPLERSRIPGCTYCHPQIASVGMTEAAAKAAGRDIRIGRFSFAANGKAIALGDDQGFVKTIFDRRTGELLGAHMVGPEVTELIQGFV